MDRKEAIIYATLDLASEKGLGAVSLAQIAERVGMRTPSLYNHFSSKDEIIKAMYDFLRQKARQSHPSGAVSLTDLSSKTLEQVLTESLDVYISRVSDRDMLRFFRVLYSERSISPVAAEVMLEETERMVQATRSLFYALAVHGKMRSDGIDAAALTFAMTVHALIDYQMDRITAGVAEASDAGEGPSSKELSDFVAWFCAQVGGDVHEQETD